MKVGPLVQLFMRRTHWDAQQALVTGSRKTRRTGNGDGSQRLRESPGPLGARLGKVEASVSPGITRQDVRRGRVGRVSSDADLGKGCAGMSVEPREMVRAGVNGGRTSAEAEDGIRQRVRCVCMYV